MIRGQGMPSYRHHDYGNLYVKFNVKFPEDQFNTPENLARLEEILPPRKTLEIPVDAMVDEVVLEQMDERESARAHQTTMEEDEEGQGGERVQCASQ